MENQNSNFSEQAVTLIPIIVNIALLIVVIYFIVKLYKKLVRFLESNTKK